MLLKPLAFATAASAFLLSPIISEADSELVDGIVTMLPVESESFAPAKSPESWSVKVPYPQSKTGDGYLQFELVAEEGAKLTANGFQLYPNADHWSVDLTANVVNANGKGKEEKLGYSMAFKPVATDAYQQMELIEVQLKVIEVGSRVVTGIPVVRVQLIRAITGDIAISNVEVYKAPGAQCSSIVCRAKEKFFEAFKSFKGCMGRIRNNGHQKLAAAKADAQQDGAGAALNTGDHSGHHDEWPHGHRHNWRLLLKNIASHIFLPVLMGITAGVGVAVYVFPLLNRTIWLVLTLAPSLAMVLCSIAIRLTRLVRSKRSKRSGLCRKKHASRQPAADVEKVGLMEAVDADVPPQHQDDLSKN